MKFSALEKASKPLSVWAKCGVVLAIGVAALSLYFAFEAGKVSTGSRISQRSATWKDQPVEFWLTVAGTSAFLFFAVHRIATAPSAPTTPKPPQKPVAQDWMGKPLE